MIKKRQLIAITTMAACLMTGMTGCGADVDASAPDAVELLNPVGVALNYEEAARRDIYDAKIYSAIVAPYAEEYELDEAISFDGFDTLPGETVEAGGTLLHGKTENIDQQIESMEKSIKQMEESQADFVENTNDSLKQPLEDQKVNGDIVANLEKSRQEPTIVKEDKDGKPVEVENPDYAAWAADYNKYDGLLRSANQSVEELQESLKQTTALYELDHAYQLKQLVHLKEDRSKYTLRSKIKGNVAAVTDLSVGDWVSAGKPLMAVADLEQLQLKSDYIGKGEVNKAVDLYCIINGGRYEVEYVPMDSDEYKLLEEQNGKVYSTFKLKTKPEGLEAGQFATIVVIKKKSENVLSVPKDAIRSDDSGNYLYLVDGTESVYTPVKTGITDGIYTEIISGVKEGDKIMTESAKSAGTQTVKVTKGSVSGQFSNSGYLIYPTTTEVKNPITYGNLYYTEACVGNYQQVQKGDVLATVRVVPDSVELERQTKKLQRENERLADLRKIYTDTSDKYGMKQIAAKEEQIAELEKKIAEMKADFAVKEIKSPISGIVTYVEHHENEDFIPKDSRLFYVADENQSFILVEDKNGVLTYGNKAEIAYNDAEGKSKTAHGTVVTLNQMSLSKALTEGGFALIMVPNDEIGDMAGSTKGMDGFWMRNHFNVKVSVREMNNVLLVPRKAVTDNNGTTYVRVKQADGTIVYKSFVAGGSDNSNYWVAEGLTEGMELCLE